MKEIETFEEKNYHEFNIFHVFLDVLQSNSQRKSCYLIDYMIKEKYADSTIIKFKGDPYFVHYLNQKEIDNMFISQNLYVKQLKENYEELSKNDWELYKKLIEEGHNPSKLAKMIRDDEIDKLQEISSQNDFDFNKNIEPSIYERCSFIDHWVSLIDYAAFFSSVKCFKYLLMNGANVKYTGKYAVAGGNEEIIHLCEQNHSSFEGACETAIEFHRNDIFKYFYDNKLKEINNLEELGKFCIFYQNYEIFSFLLKEGMNINDDIINEAATIGNMFLTRYFLRKYQQPKYILMSASKSVNFELVQFILQLKGIDINAKDIYLFYLEFILLI